MTTIRLITVFSPIFINDNQSLIDELSRGSFVVRMSGHNLGTLDDRRLAQLADLLVKGYAARAAEFPIGAFLAIDAIRERFGRTDLSVDVVASSGDETSFAYAAALARLIELISLRRRQGAGSVTARVLPLTCGSFISEGADVIATRIGDSVDLTPGPDETVVVDAQLGEATVRVNLLALAADAGTLTVIAKPGRAVIWGRGTPPETASYLSQVVQQLQPDRRPGQEGLLHVVNNEVHRPTAAALRRLEATRWSVSGSTSATAQLLLGTPAGRDLGATLADHVVRWIDQRIFDGSLVTEMVLHDQSHAMSVDRMVAAIAGPLYDDQKITGHDLYLLGCAAWLHDCGHSSAHVVAGPHDGVPSEPDFIRTLHGPLAALRIEALRDVLDLSRADAAVVGMLAAHHQGSSSAGTAAPKRSAADSNAHQAYAEQLTETLEARVDVVRRAVPEMTLGRAQQLVALLRICDAIDVGRHRVQHRDLHIAQLPQMVEIYTQRCIEAIDEGPATGPLVAILQDTRRNVVGFVRRADRVGFEGVARLARTTVAELTKGRDAAAAGRVQLWSERLLRYCGYVLDQAEYFDAHQAVNTVIPLVGGTSGSRTLELWVVAADLSSADRAVAKISEYLAKELGLQPGISPEETEAREPIRLALAELGYTLTDSAAVKCPVTVPEWWRRRLRTGSVIEADLASTDTLLEVSDQAAE